MLQCVGWREPLLFASVPAATAAALGAAMSTQAW